MFVHDDPKVLELLTRQHHDLMQAIIASEPEQARAVIGEHLAYVQEKLSQVLDAEGAAERLGRFLSTPVTFLMIILPPLITAPLCSKALAPFLFTTSAAPTPKKPWAAMSATWPMWRCASVCAHDMSKLDTSIELFGEKLAQFAVLRPWACWVCLPAVAR